MPRAALTFLLSLECPQFGTAQSPCETMPCLNGASCHDATTDASIPAEMYSCTCAPGFANGHCEFDYLVQYQAECNVPVPTSISSGNCDIDIDECISLPCYHDGVCTETLFAQEYGNWTDAKRYDCSCIEFAQEWGSLPNSLPRVPIEIEMGEH